MGLFKNRNEKRYEKDINQKVLGLCSAARLYSKYADSFIEEADKLITKMPYYMRHVMEKIADPEEIDDSSSYLLTSVGYDELRAAIEEKNQQIAMFAVCLANFDRTNKDYGRISDDELIKLLTSPDVVMKSRMTDVRAYTKDVTAEVYRFLIETGRRLVATDINYECGNPGCIFNHEGFIINEQGEVIEPCHKKYPVFDFNPYNKVFMDRMKPYLERETDPVKRVLMLARYDTVPGGMERKKRYRELNESGSYGFDFKKLYISMDGSQDRPLSQDEIDYLEDHEVVIHPLTPVCEGAVLKEYGHYNVDIHVMNDGFVKGALETWDVIRTLIDDLKLPINMKPVTREMIRTDITYNV